MLWKLLEELEKLPYDFRYRVLYLYPDIVSLKQLERLKRFKKFIPYFDIPLQHISSAVLKRMGRFYNADYIYKFLDFINKNWEEKFIRTNFIV
jgi:ribosomal protein S12 methylthiotransferase